MGVRLLKFFKALFGTFFGILFIPFLAYIIISFISLDFEWHLSVTQKINELVGKQINYKEIINVLLRSLIVLSIIFAFLHQRK